VAPPPSQVVNDIDKCLQSANPASKACRGLDKKQLQRLAQECKKKKNKDNLVCKALVVGGGGGNGPISLPSLPPLGGAAATLPRPGFGAPRPQTWSTTRGPTMGQLMEIYDPSLVDLLVPGMVVTR
jgi:phospholipid/cholesterol/gamma-HCH transport system substrate-binding protein